MTRRLTLLAVLLLLAGCDTAGPPASRLNVALNTTSLVLNISLVLAAASRSMRWGQP